MKWLAIVTAAIITAMGGTALVVGGTALVVGDDLTTSGSELIASAKQLVGMQDDATDSLSTAILLSTGDPELATIERFTPEQLDAIAACAGVDPSDTGSVTDEQLRVLTACAQDTAANDPTTTAGLSDEAIDAILACGADTPDAEVAALTDEQIDALVDCVAAARG